MPISKGNGNATVRKMIEQENEENIPPPTQPVRLDRSPHPYHRRRLSPSGSMTRSDKTLAGHHLQTATTSPYEQRHSKERLADAANQKLPMPVTSSDSGTEADDERGVVLRGLPAPPIKRKGSSPLFMPRNADDEHKKTCLDHNAQQEGSPSAPRLGDEEDRKIQNKFTRRRRVEYLRRLLEITLLSGVGFIACKESLGAFLHTLSRGLAGYCCAVFGIYLLYPLRLLYRHHTKFKHIGLNPHSLRIPAFFDPAPLLYPILLPIFVALSLTPFNPKIVLANIILSIAAIPCQIVPFDRLESGYNSLHWFLSAIPLLLARQGVANLALSSFNGEAVLLDELQAEHFILLFPLHQVLLPALGYLTTTSLLPAELQLLSISMINLLFFSTSAQAAILKALLWVGGFLLFIFCDNVFQWGVALARVPSWRFRPSHRPSRGGNILLVAINDYFHGRLSKWRLISTVDESSDSDGCKFAGSETLQKPRLERLRFKIERRKEAMQEPELEQPELRFEKKQNNFYGSPNILDPSSATPKRIPRRHTLLSYIGSPQVAPFLQRTSLLPVSRPSPVGSRALLTLTYAQATVVKWCYAVYVYVAALFIIAFPVRIAVSHWALHGHEPVGWALGYLLGDIPIFRSVILDLDLESWISLPPSVEIDQISGNNNTWHQLGAANVRLLISTYCLSVLAAGLCIVFSLTPFVEVDTRRKVFHGMMVVMFLPSILIDPAFAALALGLALAIFLLLDLFRASQLPPLSKPLTYFLAPYVDGRDHRGPVIVSHIFLLIGCAIPLWLSLAAAKRTDRLPWYGWEISSRDVSMVSGVICVGMGDAAASLFGRRFGRRRWVWGGGKSLEGSLAFAVAVVLGLSLAKLGIRLGGWESGFGGHSGWMKTLQKSTIAAFGASLTEAVLTGGNDNVIVPVVLWLLVRGLAI